MAGTTKSIRVQIYEALVAGFLDAFGADAGWAFDATKIGGEPSELPLPTSNFIGVRIMTYGRHLSATPDNYDSEAIIQDIESTVRLQAYGPLAFVWLSTFLQMLPDDEFMPFFENLGFAVVAAPAGISDISELLGSEEQVRGSAQVFVGCRSIRDRVITLVDTVTVDLTVQDPSGVHADLTSNFSTDVSEPLP